MSRVREGITVGFVDLIVIGTENNEQKEKDYRPVIDLKQFIGKLENIIERMDIEKNET
jgi:hypothetical protein